MKDLFPYIGETITVTQEMCDFNGHMNVNFIKKVFEQGWDFVNKDFGFNENYLNQGFSSFTLEDNYRFKKEFLPSKSLSKVCASSSTRSAPREESKQKSPEKGGARLS